MFYEDKKVMMGKATFVEWLMQDAKETANVPDDFFKFDFMGKLVENLQKSFLFYMNISAFNKTRRRRKLLIMFREWELIGEECIKADQKITQYFGVPEKQRLPYFLIWILDKAYQSMIDYLQLGFELGLYDEIEYPAIFWYIGNLMSWRKQHHTFLIKYDAGNPHRSKLLTAKQKKMKFKTDAVPTATAHHNRILAEANLSAAISKYILALYPDYKIANKFNFGDEKNRYITRFEAFFHIGTPQPYYYEMFQQELTKINSDVLFKESDELSKASKLTLEKFFKNPNALPTFKVDEYKAMLKIGVTNNVQIMMTKGKVGPKKIEGQRIDYNFGSHIYYPIVSLVPIKK